MKNAVFTIAVAKSLYFRMACALTRSFRLWHRDNNIEFVLATDADRASLPADLSDLKVIPLSPGQYGKGSHQKFI
jgi:hypothetical protein